MTCQFYWPDNFLINEISEELVKKGHEVTVLTGLPDYATTKVPKEYKFGKNRKQTHNGVNIIRVPIFARRHGFLCRVINYLSYMFTSTFYARTHKFDCDVIFAYQLAPVFMVNPAKIIKKKTKAPIFTYVLDLWPDQMKIWHVNENNPIFKLVLKYCKNIYKVCDLIGISSKPFKEYLVYTCDVDENKIIYLPQHSHKMNITNDNKTSDITNFIFAGNIGNQQNIECLIKAVTKMKSKKPYMFNIYGDGTSFEICNALTKELNVQDKIKFYGRVPKEELNNIYPKMDAFVLTLCSEEKLGYVAKTVPAKLQSYMSAGKPILASINGGAKDIIEESKCGKCVPADDIEGFAKILDDFIENKDDYKECGKNAVKYFNENYEKELIMNKIEKILFDLSNKLTNKF